MTAPRILHSKKVETLGEWLKNMGVDPERYVFVRGSVSYKRCGVVDLDIKTFCFNPTKGKGKRQ